MANVGSGPVAVVGESLDQQRRAARAVTLIEDCLDLVHVNPLPCPLAYRPLDVVLRHRCVAGLLHGERQRRVAVWIAATLARSDRDRPRELGELLAAAGVHDCLLVLDRMPLGVT